MKNLDALKAERAEALQALVEAQASGDKEKFEQAANRFMDYVGEMIKAQESGAIN